MKTAVLSTLANLEIAYQFMHGEADESETILYHKRRNRIFKLNGNSHVTIHNKFKIEMLRDIQREKFERIIVAELPQAKIIAHPYLLFVALLSKAKEKSLLHRDGTYTPLTFGLLARSTVSLAGSYLRLLIFLPLMISNLLLLTLFSSAVDLWLFLKPKRLP